MTFPHKACSYSMFLEQMLLQLILGILLTKVCIVLKDVFQYTEKQAKRSFLFPEIEKHVMFCFITKYFVSKKTLVGIFSTSFM
jgi:hypothetical protein